MGTEVKAVNGLGRARGDADPDDAMGKTAASRVDRAPTPRGSMRWWWGVGAGLAASVPLGWLLSYGAALMALLGLFFFALFGLVIGAVIYRVSASCRPLPKSHIAAGTAVVVAFCWGLSYWKEVHDFPMDKAREAAGRVSPLPAGMTREMLLEDVAGFVRSELGKHGWGGWGYAKWVMSSSEMKYEVATMAKPVVLRPVQYKWWWFARIVLSMVMLWFGVYSQVGPLSGMKDPPGASKPNPQA